jgi:transcription antitermination protein NusB
MQSSRRLIRIKVLQVLYAYEIAKDHIDKVKKDLLSDLQDAEKYNFASTLIDAVLKNVKQLDEMIQSKIENWEFERIALIDKLVLRIGLCEILFFSEIPPKVSINEAIEISKEYCTSQSGKFVNGILDAILIDLKGDNKLNKQGRGLLDIKKKTRDEK